MTTLPFIVQCCKRLGAAALLALLFVGTSWAQTYEATLASGNEVPALTTQASGSVTATLNGAILSVSGSFTNLASDYNGDVGAHIHTGYAGQNGGVIFSLTPTLDADNRGGTFAEGDNTFSLTTEQVAALEARQLYINIHTQANPGGELRGQLRPAGADASYRVVLSSAAAVPSNTSLAMGGMLAELNGSTLTVSGAFSGLESNLATNIAGGAHIHIGLAGQSGPVVFPLTVQTDGDLRGGVILAADNMFTLDAAQTEALISQGLYVNIHSENNTPGEIRGQLLAEAGVSFQGLLSGSNEGTTVDSQANGSVAATLDGTTLTVSGAFDGLEGDLATDIAGGAHIHGGLSGQSGSVIFPLNVQADADARGGFFAASENEFTLTADQVAQLQARGFYVNIHSEAHRSGEIRGQFMAASSTSFTVLLDGDHEVPAVSTTAGGTLLVEANNNALMVSGAYTLEGELATEIAGGAHIHDGITGRNGPVLVALNSTTSADANTFVLADNMFELDADLLAGLPSRGLYVNVHSSKSASGEIRGQIVPTASVQLDATLTGRAEVPGNTSSAFGTVLVELNNGNAIVSGGFDELESAVNTDIAGGAHLHQGDFGSNGDVVFSLASELDADAQGGIFRSSSNVFEVTTEQALLMRDSDFYVNIHTMTQAAGELRGQVVPADVVTLEATLAGENQVSLVETSATGTVIAQLDGNELTLSGSFADLSTPIAVDIAGGAHLHLSGAGTNGDVIFPLTIDADVAMLNGTFEPESNVYTLTDEQRAAMIDGDFYVNVHSLGNMSGELRGQMLVSTNVAPSASEITAPDPNTAIVLEGNGSTELTIDWTDASDPNANDVTYVWELATDANFDNVVLTQRVESESELVLTVGAVDGLLGDLGIEAGATVTVFHRATASDGSTQTTGMPEEAMFTRGVVTSNEGAADLPTQFALQGNYPNPFNPTTTIRFDLDRSATVSVAVYDILGRQVLNTPEQTFQAGRAQQISLDASALASGLYIYRVTVEGRDRTEVRAGQMTLLK